MKKITAAVLFWIFFVIGGCVMGTLCNPTSTHNIYPLVVQIIEIGNEADVVVGIDGAGNCWEFSDVEDWQVNDFAALLMDDNGTPSNIYDDVITMTRYAGTFEG